MFYDNDGQKERYRVVLEKYTEYTRERVNEDGELMGYWKDNQQTSVRDKIWAAFAYLESSNKDDHIRANHIIKNMITKECHFTPMIATQILVKNKDKLSEENKIKLFDYLNASVKFLMGKDNDFVGVNDNFPSMAAYTSIIGGTLIGNQALYQNGVNNLKRAVKLLKRRGTTSEHTSPTYTPIQAMAMAEIANYAKEEYVKDMALAIEKRLWTDILGHFHKNIGKMAGPYSRAYVVDSTARVHIADFLLYTLLGEKLKVNPVEVMFSDKEGSSIEVVHGNSAWFMWSQFIWISASTYHCPTEIAEWALNRSFPFEFNADCEYSSSRDDFVTGAQEYAYRAAIGYNRCYMTSEYALGVGEVSFHNGRQTDLFYAMYRKVQSVQKQSDVGCVYARYIVNEAQPKLDEMLWDEGQKIGLSNRNMALIGYKPMRYIKNIKVNSLKLSVLIPVIGTNVEKILVGEKDIAGLHVYSTDKLEPVFIKDNDVYMAIYPLNPAQNVSVKIEKIDNYIMISIYNYLGYPKQFDLSELESMCNGFAFAIESKDEAGGFESFINEKYTLTDEVYATPHSRGTHLRNLLFKRRNSSIEMEYDIENHGIKYELIDDAIPRKPSIYTEFMDVLDDK